MRADKGRLRFLRALALLALAVLAIMWSADARRVLATAEKSGDAGAPAIADPLKAPAEFSGIADPSARSVALFAEALRVIQHPRCLNCHPSTGRPTQGEDLHPHVPYMEGGKDGHGARGLTCHACHQADNVSTEGAAIPTVPGNAHWALAPASMAWQDKTPAEICRQLKDPAQTGGRDLQAIRRHVATDNLVAWGWTPGAGRKPAPGTQEQFVKLIDAWIETGAACPSDGASRTGAVAGNGAGRKAMTESRDEIEARNKSLVEAKFAAWRAGTGSPFELLTDDATWTIVGRSVVSKTYSRDAFLGEVIRPFNARMRDPLKPTIRSLHADGDAVVIFFDAQGVARDGQPYVNTYAWFFEMRDGRVTRAFAFFDSLEFNDLWKRVSPAQASGG
jgi:ketosteroid isomerase-like protein